MERNRRFHAEIVELDGGESGQMKMLRELIEECDRLRASSSLGGGGESGEDLDVARPQTASAPQVHSEQAKTAMNDLTERLAIRAQHLKQLQVSGVSGGVDADLMHEAAARFGKIEPLVAALMAWVENSEGMPGSPNDADLMKAFWTFDGDRIEPCPECDGDCGEPCAPCTVEAAHRMLDQFSADWKKRHGIAQLPPSAPVAAGEQK